MKEAQQVVTEKTSALEAEAYKTKRLQVICLPIILTIMFLVFKSVWRKGMLGRILVLS